MHITPTSEIKAHSRRFVTLIAEEPRLIRAAQALRYHVFAEEMGAQLHTTEPGYDVDEVDAFCDHLVVMDTRLDKVIGCTRLLNGEQASRLGRFYSEGEFNLGGVLSMPGRFLEIGRTCVDSTYRGGAVIASLWSGLADYAQSGRFDYLMGCASIPPGPSGFAVEAVYRQIESHQMGPQSLQVTPKHPVPARKRCERDESGIPPLLQAYLRLGAWVCGEPCWDEDFNCMDVFILLDLERLQTRYEKRFIGPRDSDTHPAAVV